MLPTLWSNIYPHLLDWHIEIAAGILFTVQLVNFWRDKFGTNYNTDHVDLVARYVKYLQIKEAYRNMSKVPRV